MDRELSRVSSVYAHTSGLANRRTRAARASASGGGPALGAALARSYSLCQMMGHIFRQVDLVGCAPASSARAVWVLEGTLQVLAVRHFAH